MNQNIDKLTQLGTDAVQSAVASYTAYFITSSICWLLIGVACIIAAFYFYKKFQDEEFALPICGLLVLVGILTIPINLPTLLHPRAYAIHQLITDAAK